MKSFFGKCVAALAGLLARGFAFLLASLPLSVRSFVGDIIGWLWFDIFRIRRRVAIDNIRLAFPELSDRQAVAMARLSLRHMGRNIVEYSLFPFFNEADISRHFDIEGMEHLEKAYAKGRGVIFLGLHMGNGDLGIAAMSRLGWPVSLISKNFKAKWLNDLWFGMRSKHGTQFIAPEKSSFQILRALKSKRVVFFVLDQFMGPPIGCRTTFFGRETGTAMGLAIMAERSGSPVVPVYTFRKEDGRHQIVFGPEILWRETAGNISTSKEKAGGSDENITSMTQIYTDKIEETIRKHPEQWMWIHRRWKNFG